jgi:endonuclease/exonuclease/phosphatase family metal-dependent hydrolase
MGAVLQWGVDDQLKIATFNAENFYLLLDRDYSPAEFAALDDDQVQAMNASIYNPNKNLENIATIARTIRAHDFDFVAMVEVGGLETLRNFNRYYLDQRYDCFLHEENSRRGIFVGALVKKGRFHRVRARNVGGSFSRNLLELRLHLGPVELRFYVLHLKSHFGLENGIEIRRQEVEQLCRILPSRHCVVMGDFNGILIPGQHQFEFEPFLALPFRDVLEAMGVPPEERITHYFFAPEPHFNQLDYIFCSNDMQILDAAILTEFVPATREERLWLPSDHCFLTARIRPGRAFPALPRPPAHSHPEQAG